MHKLQVSTVTTTEKEETDTACRQVLIGRTNHGRMPHSSTMASIRSTSCTRTRNWSAKYAKPTRSEAPKNHLETERSVSSQSISTSKATFDTWHNFCRWPSPPLNSLWFNPQQSSEGSSGKCTHPFHARTCPERQSVWAVAPSWWLRVKIITLGIPLFLG